MSYLPGAASMANVGAGAGVLRDIAAGVANLRSLTPAEAIGITPGVDELAITATAGVPNNLAGIDDPLQSSLYQDRLVGLLPDSTTFASGYGMSFVSVGTMDHPALSPGLFASLRRMRWTSGAAANAAAGIRGNANLVWRSNIANAGGFMFHSRFGHGIAPVATQLGFMGLRPGTSAPNGGTSPSTIANILAFAYDPGDTTWSIMHNDGAGSATVIPIGAGAPVDDTTVYDGYIYAAPNATEVTFRLVNLVTGTAVVNNVVVNTDMPVDTTFLDPYIYVGNDVAGGVVDIQIARIFLETVI